MVQKRKKAIPRPSFFITTIPVIRLCERCGVPLAAGISEGMHVRMDLTPLDDWQCMMVILAKLRLFSMSRTGLVEMDHHRMTDPRFRPRYPEHRCGVVWPNRLQVSNPVPHLVKDDSPPF